MNHFPLPAEFYTVFRAATACPLRLCLFSFLVFASTLSASPMKVVQLTGENPLQRFSPGALPSLLAEASKHTTARFDPEVVFITRLDDPKLLQSPFLYINVGDRPEWTFSPAEEEALRDYLRHGGFLLLDAGITAEFLRGDAAYGQRHSFANYEVMPEIEAFFKKLFPAESFRQLPRSHPIFSAFYSGLPDPSFLPDTVRDYVVNEKWPQGSYSFLGLHLDDRLAVLATPILALGWTRNELGQWINPIGFRVRESAEGLSERLQDAAYSGVRFEVRREDGRLDIVYCQPETIPAWVQEPDGTWRVFRYYTTNEISDYAHLFYMRLGINILTFLLTE